MSVSVPAIRDAIQAKLLNISGFRAYDIIPDSIQVPCGIVGAPSCSYDLTYGRGIDKYNFIIRVLVSRSNLRSAQDALDAYLAPTGASSIKVAVEAGGGTLGGTVDVCRVTGFNGYGQYVVGDTTYLGAELPVECWASGT